MSNRASKGSAFERELRKLLSRWWTGGERDFDFVIEEDYVAEMTKELAIRFVSKVDVRGMDECWNWTAGLNSRKPMFRYGLFWVQKVGHVLAHRFSLALRLGRWPEGLVLHSCDNPTCCNPNHLREGTQLENMRDMKLRGRRQCERGTDRHCAKLDEDKVRQIRKLYDPAKRNKAALARRFGVDKNVIELVAQRKSWRHVE